jgi:hypothetical protein
MKIAVCLSGGVKFHQNSLSSLKKLLPTTSLKVFIHTYEIEDINLFNSNSWSKKHSSSDDFESIINLYKADRFLIENFDKKKQEFTELFNKWEKKHLLVRNDLGVISMFYSIYKSNELKCEYEKNNNIIFDRVIRMRFDSNIFEPLNLENFTGLNIPLGNDYGGINDQFAIGDSKYMDIYSNVIKNLENLTNILYHPETILYTHLNMMNLKINRFDHKIKINNNL